MNQNKSITIDCLDFMLAAEQHSDGRGEGEEDTTTSESLDIERKTRRTRNDVIEHKLPIGYHIVGRSYDE